MKKIFSRLGVESDHQGADPHHHHHQDHDRDAGGGAAGASLVPSGTQWTVGRHQVVFEEVIAEGGFGVVFLVNHKKDSGMKFALKRMFVNNDKDLAVCKREINIVSNLNGHRNLIGYVDSSISLLDGGVHEVLLLTPYHRTTLLQLMNDRLGKGFKEEEVLKVFCDICSAVARLHHCQTPIIHRDLKVENVLQSSSGNFVLCDFGSATAKVLNPATQGITQVEEEIKRYTTLSYRAPEMIDLYQEIPLTEKTDIWALGCMLFKICFFSPPFGESSLAIQDGNFNFPTDSKFSENMHKLIRYCLTVDVASRPDIYKVAYLANSLAGRECNVQNLHNVKVPQFSELSVSNPKTAPAKASSSSVKADSKSSSTASSAPTQVQQPNLGLVNSGPQSLSLGMSDAQEHLARTRIATCPSPSSTNTSVVPRQRPRGAANLKAVGPMSLPLPPSGPGSGSTIATASGNQASATAPVAPPTTSTNPFVTSSPARQSGRAVNSNPFAAPHPDVKAATSGPSNPFLSSISGSKSAGKPSWNPFEDTKNFSQLSEEALFGEQFDQIRKMEAGSETQNPRTKRQDPFMSAPFVKN